MTIPSIVVTYFLHCFLLYDSQQTRTLSRNISLLFNISLENKFSNSVIYYHIGQLIRNDLFSVTEAKGHFDIEWNAFASLMHTRLSEHKLAQLQVTAGSLHKLVELRVTAGSLSYFDNYGFLSMHCCHSRTRQEITGSTRRSLITHWIYRLLSANHTRNGITSDLRPLITCKTDCKGDLLSQ